MERRRPQIRQTVMTADELCGDILLVLSFHQRVCEEIITDLYFLTVSLSQFSANSYSPIMVTPLLSTSVQTGSKLNGAVLFSLHIE